MIKVASYNIRKSLGTDRRRDPARILRVLNQIDADVIALQEVDKRFGARISALPSELVASSPYTPVTFGMHPEGLGWHGNAILVRDDVEILDQKRLTLPALEPRGAAIADVNIKGVKLRIVGMHLGLVGHWRIQQARAIVEALDEIDDTLPTVMMGDLNQWGAAGGALAQFERSHNVAKLGKSYHSRIRMADLDRIITSKDLRISSAGVHVSDLARKASDHLPVWACLEAVALQQHTPEIHAAPV